MKRMAAHHPPEREKEALEGAMFLDRLRRIFGTGGEKSAAVTDKWADRRLIKTN